MSGGCFVKIMARKPRSQRRKKGGDGDAAATLTTTKNGDSSKDNNNRDALSDTYTVDDNLSVLSFAEDFAFGGVGGGALSTVPYDWCSWLAS